MKFFTPSEKRFLWFLATLLFLGFLVKEGRTHYRRLARSDENARESALQDFREGHKAYLAAADSQAASLWRIGLEQQLDINRASLEELQLIPGIGPVLAKKIVDYRKKNGYFRTIDDLTEIKGIGPKLIQRWEGFIVVQPNQRVKEGAFIE